VLPARLLTTLPNTIYTYAVYEVAPPAFTPPKQEAGAVPPFPKLLTPAATATKTFKDERFEVGVERCYAVSTVATTGAVSIESPLSKPSCVKAVDTFPPSAPTKLEAVASEGAISLIWEASPQPDVAGYLVLRGEAGGAPLAPLFTTPIKETTYRDVSVKPGVRYVYAVVAVDTAVPRNVSPHSNRVEETAR
jgi:fibronectin type 3 domain-containing protein